MSIAHGVLSEDNYLIQEILFNPNSLEQLGLIQKHLTELSDIISRRDGEAMEKFLARARENIK